MTEAFRIMIGSIGDDSHSVGMALLEIAFKEAGFVVKNIGILNTLDDFFLNAPGFDAILISCMNGHVELYFDDFPYLKKKFENRNGTNRLWYLGGNLSVRETPESVTERFRRMGFDFVSARPISVDTILERLNKDFYQKGIKKKTVPSSELTHIVTIPEVDTVDDEPMTDATFLRLRQEVLDSWPTGSEVYDADISLNHASPDQNFHYVLTGQNGRPIGKPLVQPRTGVAHTEDEIDILLSLRESGLDMSSVQLDAASRKKMFDKAQEGVMKTEKNGKSLLNGYPVPVHGVKGIQQILKAIETPFQVRAGSPDHRLVYEIGLAGGASSLEGGFLCYLFPYDKRTSPVESLGYWKYVDKLSGWYRRFHGVTVNREYFGPLTCCLIEPSIPICINIIQAILSAKSGVHCISVGVAEQGHRSQDIAAIRVLEKLTRSYLDAYGYGNCSVTTVFHHYMAAFPNDIAKAEDLILNSSITGALAGANRIMTKTPVEAHHIPTRKDNARGLELTHRGLLMAGDQKVNEEAVRFEAELLEREVIAMMTAMEELGGGSIARGAIKGCEAGILDIPFSPTLFNRHTLITARDSEGAIRFVNPDQLPFNDQLIDIHKEKIHRRMTDERTNRVSEILEKDLTRVWKNDFLQWPLDGSYIY